MNDKYKLTPLNSNASVVLDFEKCGAEWSDAIAISDNQMLKHIDIAEYEFDSKPADDVVMYPDYMENIAPLIKVMETGVVSAHFKFPAGHSTLLNDNGITATIPLFVDDFRNDINLMQLHGVLNLDDNKYVRAQLLCAYSWNASTHKYVTRITYRIQIKQRT